MIKVEEYNKLSTYINISLSLLTLLAGGFVYSMFRTDNAYMFNWFGAVGIADLIYNMRDTFSQYSVYGWVKYNLPASLWLMAYLFAIAAIWNGHRKSFYFKFFIWLMTFMALMTEVLQFLDVIPGTFDITDVLSYAIVTAIFFVVNKYI